MTNLNQIEMEYAAKIAAARLSKRKPPHLIERTRGRDYRQDIRSAAMPGTQQDSGRVFPTKPSA